MHVLETFKGVEHRTQFVVEWQGRKFYNDSKATNILATQSALKGFKNPVVLLLVGWTVVIHLTNYYHFQKM